jgi:hypothetical protein
MSGERRQQRVIDGAFMAGVRSKLEEAQRRLDRMREAEFGGAPQVFKDELNAFLGSYRSVMYRIEREARRVRQDHDVWLRAEQQRRGFPWKPPGKDAKWQAGDDVLLTLKSLRDTDVHQDDVQLGANWYMSMLASAQASASLSAQVTRADGTLEPLTVSNTHSTPQPMGPPPTSTALPPTRHEWVFNTPDRPGVVTGCKHALEVLAKLVDDYEARGLR